jgi:hypothetical protein
MKSTALSTSLFGCFALGLATAGCYAPSDLGDDESENTTDERTSATRSENPNTSEPTSATSSGLDQARIARTTLALENQFSDQFTRGQIVRTALEGAIDDVIQAMPEAARAKVQKHIDWILYAGNMLAPELTAEQRAAASAPPSDEKTQQTHEALVTSWGWPGLAGWGGYGAFAFPGMYGGLGFNPVGYNAPGFNPYVGNPPGYNPPGVGLATVGFDPVGWNPPGVGFGGYPGFGYGGYGGFGGPGGFGYGGPGGYGGYGGFGYGAPGGFGFGGPGALGYGALGGFGYGGPGGFGFGGPGLGYGYSMGYSTSYVASYSTGYSSGYGLGYPGWF